MPQSLKCHQCNKMNKETFLKNHGNKKLLDIAGILHNYIKISSLTNHKELDKIIGKHQYEKLVDSIDKFEHLLEF